MRLHWGTRHDTQITKVGDAELWQEYGILMIVSLVVLSAGLGGLVDRHIERLSARLGGTAGYCLAALAAVANNPGQPLRARLT